MSVLVTGAAGFIGSCLTDELLRQGCEVVGFDCFDDFYDPAVKERNLEIARDHESFTLVRGDVRSQADLERIPDHVDSVVHLAARAGVRPSIADPQLYADVNLMGTARLLTWMKVRHLGTMLFASSSSVYGNNDKIPFSESDRVDHPISPYAATKKGGELLCHSASHLDSITIACLRFFTVYGPRQRPDLAIHKFARILRAGGTIPMYGDGSSSRDYTYVDDIVSGVIKALDWASERDTCFDVFNLGNRSTVELSEMISVLGEELGVTPRIERQPKQPGDVDRTYADISHARTVLGYEPLTEFREGVRRFIEWLQDVEASG